MLSQFSRTGKHCSLFPYLKLCTEGNAVPRLCGQGVRAPALGPARRWSQHGIRCRFVSSLSALPPPFFFLPQPIFWSMLRFKEWISVQEAGEETTEYCRGSFVAFMGRFFISVLFHFSEIKSLQASLPRNLYLQ